MKKFCHAVDFLQCQAGKRDIGKFHIAAAIRRRCAASLYADSAA